MRPFNSQDGSGLKQSDENSTFVSLRRDFLGRTFCATKADLRWLQTVDFSFKSPPTLCQIARNAFPTSCIFDVRGEFEAGLVRGRVKNLYYFLHRFTLFSCQKSGSPETFFAFHIKNYFLALYFETLGKIRQSFYNILIKLCGFELCVCVLPASHPFV